MQGLVAYFPCDEMTPTKFGALVFYCLKVVEVMRCPLKPVQEMPSLLAFDGLLRETGPLQGCLIPSVLYKCAAFPLKTRFLSSSLFMLPKYRIRFLWQSVEVKMIWREKNIQL